MDLVLETYKLLKKIRDKEPKNFSGIGLVVYDSKKLDSECHCDLRPNQDIPPIMVYNDEACHYLCEIAEHHHDFHDGFHFVNEEGILTHIAQYFVPPVVPQLQPNQNHGVRLHSSLCGSTLAGVLFTAVICSDLNVFVFKDGHYVDLEKLERIQTYEDHAAVI